MGPDRGHSNHMPGLGGQCLCGQTVRKEPSEPMASSAWSPGAGRNREGPGLVQTLWTYRSDPTALWGQPAGEKGSSRAQGTYKLATGISEAEKNICLGRKNGK